MNNVVIGLVREGRIPQDKRVPFTPLQVEEILQRFPNSKVIVQKSPVRSFLDDEYEALDIPVQEDMSNCDILMGIKEVQIPDLIPGKTYLFFSHTLKKQPHNRKLFQEILKKKIRLIDYEMLRDLQGNRLVAFGRFAGIVGAYNALWTYGKRYGRFAMRRAFECFDINDLKLELRKVNLPPIKIILTGAGRVGKGAMETLDTAGIRKVNPADFLSGRFDEPVYVQLSSGDYHVRVAGGHFNREEFHQNPELYTSLFSQFTAVADLLIAGAYWKPGAPLLFNEKEMRSDNFRIKIIADITCDINGSIPSTKRATSIVDPLYDYNPADSSIHTALSDDRFITVMAIDNLPCELPRGASQEFGRDLIDKILRPLLVKDPENVIGRATLTDNGDVTKHFEYLRDYAAS